MRNNFKVGDIVKCKETGVSIKIEDINSNGWIWSDKLIKPYVYDNRTIRNYHNPIYFEIDKQKIREKILNKLGI
jgi:hypothetical protein